MSGNGTEDVVTSSLDRRKSSVWNVRPKRESSVMAAMTYLVMAEVSSSGDV